MPKVSILMPAYNASRYIAQTIQSIQQQDFLDWELIIANDGSTDGTVAVIESFACHDSRIKLIDNLTNSGSYAKMRTLAFQHAKGQYIAHMDADDYYNDDTVLGQLYNHLQNHKTCKMVYGLYGNIDDQDYCCEGQLPGIIWHKNKFYIKPGYIMPEHTWYNLLTLKVDNHMQGMLFDRTVIETVGQWDEKCGYYADFNYTLKTYYYYWNYIHALPLVVFRYRVAQSNNLTNKSGVYLERLNCSVNMISNFFKQY
jgi:glycosyltransferase involved in cell wall biosynthesis